MLYFSLVAMRQRREPESERGQGMTAEQFSTEFLAAQKVRLEEERSRFAEQVRGIDAEIISLGQSQKDEGGVGNHMADEGSDAQETDNDLGIRANMEAVLAEIDHALTKFGSGTYGICEDTGVPIAEARLEALPYARYTVAAQEKREKSGTFRAIPSIR